MDPHADDPGSKQRAWFSPYLLAVGLSLALFQTNTTLSCKSGDTTLSGLAVIVDGQDAIVGFDPDVWSYSISLPLGTDEALVDAVSTDPHARVWIDVVIQDERFRYLDGGFGGGEMVVPLPPGPSTIEVWVRAPKGASDFYEVSVDIGINVDFCVEQPIDCSASAKCLTDGVCDASCDPVDAANGLCERCPGKDLPVANGTPCSLGVCTDGTCGLVGPDTETPVITGFDFDPKQIDISSQSQSVECTINASDTGGSGMHQVACGFRSPTGVARYCVARSSSTGDEWRCSILFEPGTEGGLFTLYLLEAVDEAGNRLAYLEEDFGSLGVPTELQVTYGAP